MSEALRDPRPRDGVEMGEGNAYAMHEPPSRMELIADLIKETHRIEKHAAFMESSYDRLHARYARLEAEKDQLIERLVKAERALVDAEHQDSAIPAAVYMESLDEDYITTLRSENDEARSF